MCPFLQPHPLCTLIFKSHDDVDWTQNQEVARRINLCFGFCPVGAVTYNRITGAQEIGEMYGDVKQVKHRLRGGQVLIWSGKC